MITVVIDLWISVHAVVWTLSESALQMNEQRFSVLQVIAPSTKDNVANINDSYIYLLNKYY